MAQSNKEELHNQINELLDTLQTNNHRLQLNEGRFPQIEIDLLRKAAIELYDSINKLHIENMRSPKIEESKPVPHVGLEEEGEVELPAEPEMEAVAEEEIIPEEPETIEPVIEEKQAETEPVPEPEPVAEPVSKAKTPVKEKKAKDKPASNTKSKRLHEKLTNSKITSIKKAISISKRYELQHLLFQDNKALYNKALEELDAMGSIEEANAYFQHLVKDLDWDEDQKLVQEFFSYVERRFM